MKGIEEWLLGVAIVGIIILAFVLGGVLLSAASIMLFAVYVVAVVVDAMYELFDWVRSTWSSNDN